MIRVMHVLEQPQKTATNACHITYREGNTNEGNLFVVKIWKLMISRVSSASIVANIG